MKKYFKKAITAAACILASSIASAGVYKTPDGKCFDSEGWLVTC